MLPNEQRLSDTRFTRVRNEYIYIKKRTMEINLKQKLNTLALDRERICITRSGNQLGNIKGVVKIGIYGDTRDIETRNERASIIKNTYIKLNET